MRKTGETQATNECQWLSDGHGINPKYVPSGGSDKECNVVFVYFGNGEFTASK
jgi:hypothetical protein